MNCQLEGGGFSAGSTCGVVSGGCLAIGIHHLDDIREGNPIKIAGLHNRLQEYTSWFEKEFSSSLCRERAGVNVNKLSGFLGYLFRGRFMTRCIYHEGKAVNRLADMISVPLPETEADGIRNIEHCAVGVLQYLRKQTGIGSEEIEALYVTMNGGVGLSGGLCGAIAAAFVPIGWQYGIDPVVEGISGTVKKFLKGHVNLYGGKQAAELWAIGQEFIGDCLSEFGSLECQNLTGRKFRGLRDFAGYTMNADVCRKIKMWSAAKTITLLNKYAI